MFFKIREIFSSFFSSISGWGKIVFILSIIITIALVWQHKLVFYYHLPFLLLGIPFAVTYLFEFIYNLFRNRPSS
jgi:hypothetical protein